jgi:hypothetical protein
MPERLCAIRWFLQSDAFRRSRCDPQARPVSIRLDAVWCLLCGDAPALARCNFINRDCLADVRLAPNSGAEADIARGPRSAMNSMITAVQHRFPHLVAVKHIVLVKPAQLDQIIEDAAVAGGGADRDPNSDALAVGALIYRRARGRCGRSGHRSSIAGRDSERVSDNERTSRRISLRSAVSR